MWEWCNKNTPKIINNTIIVHVMGDIMDGLWNEKDMI